MGQEPTLRAHARFGFPLPPLAGGAPDPDPPGSPAPPSPPTPPPAPSLTPPADPPASPPAGDPPGEPKTFDEAYVKQLRGEAAGYRTRVNDLETRLKEFEDRDKTDQQKLAEERDGLKSKVPSLEQENLRLRVAMDKQLPANLIDRLRGATKEELEADADQLLQLVKAPEPQAPGGPRFDGGVRQTPTDDANAQPGYDRMARGFAQLYGDK